MLALFAALLLARAASAAAPARSVSPGAFDAHSRDAVAARLDEAFALYAKGLKLLPDWDKGLWEAGSVAYDRDKYAECVPLFNRLTAIKPDWGLASIYLGNGDTNTAAEYTLRAAEANPNDFAPHLLCGRTLLESDNNVDAAVELETAVRLAPGSADAQHEEQGVKRLRKTIDAAHLNAGGTRR